MTLENAKLMGSGASLTTNPPPEVFGGVSPLPTTKCSVEAGSWSKTGAGPY